MKKDLSDTPFRHSDFVIPSSLDIRHSSFLNLRAGGNYKAPAFAQLRRGGRMSLTRPRWRMSQMKPIMLTGECNAVHDYLRCSHKRHDNCQDKERQSPRTKAATKALKPVNIKEGKRDQSDDH